MDISFCKNILIRYTQTFQYFDLSCLKLLPLGKSEREMRMSPTFMSDVFFTNAKCWSENITHFSVISGKLDVFCGYWMNVCFHSCMPLFRTLLFVHCLEIQILRMMSICALYFLALMMTCFCRSILCVQLVFFKMYFFKVLLISVKEAFLYQIHTCKFSVIVSVRNGKCITFKIPQLKEYVFYFFFWC